MKRIINIMKIISSHFIVIMFVVSSIPALPQPGKGFNSNAKQYFMDNIHSFDLSPLSNPQKCILEQTVTNDLDELNNARTVLLYDSLMLRTYSDPYLQLPFTFLQEVKTNKFHFIWIPSLKDMIYNVESLYEELNDTLYSLKEPVSAIKVHAPAIDQLFNNGYLITSEKAFYDRLHVAEFLMKEVLPTIYLHEISLSTFQKEMGQMVTCKELSKTNYDFIENRLIAPMSKVAFHRFDTFYLNRVGYFVIVYGAADPRNEFKVELYFIPEKVRLRMARGASSNYRDCFK